MPADRLLSFEQIAQYLGINVALSGRPIPYVIQPDGSRSAWLSDVARGTGLRASSLAHRLRLAEIAALERR